MSTLVDLSNFLQSLPKALEVRQAELQAAADGQRARIQQRTAQGIGYNLQIFPPYAEATKKADPVNLRQTGDMLNSITTYADDDAGHVFFGDPKQEQIATFHNEGTKHLPARPFFGVSNQDRQTIIEDIRAALFRRINNL